MLYLDQKRVHAHGVTCQLNKSHACCLSEHKEKLDRQAWRKI